MNYGTIKKYDIANGEGVRITLFVSGCTNCCEECFQPETWDFGYGELYTDAVEEDILAFLDQKIVDGLSVLGGEPFELSNQRGLVKLLRRAKEKHPEKSIWCYTGFLADKDLVPGGKRFCEVTEEMLSYIDVLVDGPFMKDKKNIQLKFRGSENQRVIDLAASRKEGGLVPYFAGEF